MARARTPPNEVNEFDPILQARLETVLTEKYIHTPMNKEIWFLLEDLMLQTNPKSPKPKVMGCLITGRPHSGKTTAVRQFKKAYIENVTNAKDQDVVIFQIPSRAQLKGVIYKLGNLIKIPDLPISTQSGYSRYPTFILVEKVAQKLWSDGTKLVIIDEFQKLFELSTENRAEILSGFNDLVNESHIPIILVGVDGVDKILDLDHYEDVSNLKGTFCSRFPEYKLKPWNDPDEIDFVKLLHTIYTDCRFAVKGDGNEFFKDSKTRDRILEMTGGLTGKIIHLIKWAARDVIRSSGEGTITPALLESTYSTIQARGW